MAKPADAETAVISIHAPVKGATLFAHGAVGGQPISIHAPVKGATSLPDRPEQQARNFNPRSREGSDQQQQANAEAFQISIHAPVKGATTFG